MDKFDALPLVLLERGVRVRAGKVCCPVHGESNPSMSVSTGRAVCFACGFSGDVYDLVMELDNVGFAEARRRVDEVVGAGGVEVRDQPGRGDSWIPRGKRDQRRDGRPVPPWDRD